MFIAAESDPQWEWVNRGDNLRELTIARDCLVKALSSFAQAFMSADNVKKLKAKYDQQHLAKELVLMDEVVKPLATKLLQEARAILAMHNARIAATS